MGKEVEKKSSKEKKHFFKDFKAELKKVIWPTPKQVVNNTVAVITIVLITAVIVFALDLVFGAINTHGIGTIRSLVTSQKAETSENTTNEINNTTVEVQNTTETQTSENSTVEANAVSAGEVETTE